MIKPCCSKFSAFCIQYADLVINDDESLRLISELLLRVNVEILPLTGDDLRNIAYEIEQYLNRKNIREHVLFNRTTRRCTLDPSEMRLEKLRIREKLKGET